VATVAEAWSRVRRRLARARQAQLRRDRNRSAWGRTATAVVCLFTGVLVMASALNARGTDLRPGRNTDLVSLVESQSRRNGDLARRLTTLREGVDRLAGAAQQDPSLQPELERDTQAAGLRAVSGPAVTVTLADAPDTVAAVGVDPDLLVVHQQDIQAVVNALWQGGAEAMTIQGQRVISTTGVKCVGNTVVLHGIPYAPPYVISAIGDQSRLEAALDGSRSVGIYQQYVAAYGLRYEQHRSPRLEFPAHVGTLDLTYAQVEQDTPTGEPTPR
jgi:uncharacterized protein YlxW (UPF0749 family)